MTFPHIIYGLIDPNTKELRYIGYSSNLQKRYYNHHLMSALKANTYRNHWIKSLLAKGQKAEMIVIESYPTPEELPQAEIEMIAYYKYIGCNLTNGTAGGDGSTKKIITEETRLKLRNANLGKVRSKETKEKISKSSKGKKFPNRKKVSDESKMRMSEAQKGRKHSRESREKISKSNMGKKMSVESRKKMSESRKKMTWKLIDGVKVYSLKANP